MTSNWEKFSQYFKQQEVPAKSVLLKEGKVSRTRFFIQKGCLRTWVNNDGQEITTQFFFEGDSVSSIETLEKINRACTVLKVSVMVS